MICALSCLSGHCFSQLSPLLKNQLRFEDQKHDFKLITDKSIQNYLATYVAYNLYYFPFCDDSDENILVGLVETLRMIPPEKLPEDYKNFINSAISIYDNNKCDSHFAIKEIKKLEARFPDVYPIFSKHKMLYVSVMKHYGFEDNYKKHLIHKLPSNDIDEANKILAEYYIMTAIRLRAKVLGVEDIFINSVDGLSAFINSADSLKCFSNTIKAIYPETKIQRFMVFHLRKCLKYIPYKNRKEFCADMKPIYEAINEEQAKIAFQVFLDKWHIKTPNKVK